MFMKRDLGTAVRRGLGAPQDGVGHEVAHRRLDAAVAVAVAEDVLGVGADDPLRRAAPDRAFHLAMIAVWVGVLGDGAADQVVGRGRPAAVDLTAARC